RRNCYEDLGEFKTDPPFDNTLGFQPQCIRHISVTFQLFTNGQPTSPQILDLTDSTTITNSYFDGGLKTVFIVHGYRDSASSQWVKDMTAALLQREQMNVIAVDWSQGADSINYYISSANTRVVGALMARMMSLLNEETQASYGDMHIVGHSLGAHIGGYAGAQTPGLGRITGLDPAGPCFEEQDVIVRLDPNDANYVDVIHTDGDSLLELGFGCDRPLGDSDFYPNGGMDQPGCPANVGTTLFELVSGKMSDFDVACSHLRVLALFTESITSSCRFQAVPCDSKSKFDNNECIQCGDGCADMGYDSSPSDSGTFYLTTSDGSNGSYCQTPT
ncbi:hypothetical protein FSP39_021249, partial [Pinctada imbricata]